MRRLSIRSKRNRRPRPAPWSAHRFASWSGPGGFPPRSDRPLPAAKLAAEGLPPDQPGPRTGKAGQRRHDDEERKHRKQSRQGDMARHGPAVIGIEADERVVGDADKTNDAAAKKLSSVVCMDIGHCGAKFKGAWKEDVPMNVRPPGPRAGTGGLPSRCSAPPTPVCRPAP